MTCMAEFTPHAGELLICFDPGDVVLDSFFLDLVSGKLFCCCWCFVLFFGEAWEGKVSI